MIFDKIENSELYSVISSNLKKGFDFLKSTDLEKLEPGRHDIDGNEVFALVSEYETKKHIDCKPEAHRVYTDIQYLVSGNEIISYEPLTNQTPTLEHNPEKDIAFYSGNLSPIVISKGMFAVFFPQDIHQPCMMINDLPGKVKKIVIKLKL